MADRIRGLDTRTLATFVAVTAGVLVGNLVNFLAPLVVDSLTAHGLSVRVAGYVISAEFSAIALSALIIAPRIHRVSKRGLALFGCSAAALLNILSIFAVSQLGLLMAARFAAGLVEGLAMAAAGAVVAAMVAPDRVFAFVKVINALVTAAAMIVGGYLVKAYGVAGCYGALAAFTLALVPIMLWMPTAPAGERHAPLEPGEGMPHMFLGCWAIFGLIFWMTSASLGWPFIARFGTDTGMPIEQVSSVLSATVAAGMLGGLAAAFVRLHRVVAIAIGATSCGLAWLLMGSALTPGAFIAGAVLNSVAYYFTVPFILGMSAALDIRGRWSAVATSSLLVGMMIAPLIGGAVLETYGSIPLAVLIAVTQGIAIAIMAYVGRRVNRLPETLVWTPATA